MKVYPKIPRYDHPVVPDDFFDAADLTVLEKLDGSSFRFTLVDDRFRDVYPDRVITVANETDDLVFGTRKTVRGATSDALETIDGALHRAVRCLREGINTTELRRIHGEIDGPIVIYAENLVYSTLDYGFTEQALPALMGFDILPYREIDSQTPAGNPYAETFEGFLDLKNAWEVFDRISVENSAVGHSFTGAPILQTVESGFDPESYSFPHSELNDEVLVEGVVIRSDSADRRVKIVREEFRELNREQFGKSEDQVTDGAEVIVAKYCTSGRIRNQVRKLVVEEGREFGVHLNEELYPRVVEDMWEENWQEIMELDITFSPAAVYPLVAERCIKELRQMKTNAALNETDPLTIWQHLE